MKKTQNKNQQLRNTSEILREHLGCLNYENEVYMNQKKKGQVRKKLLVFNERCACEEKAGYEMNGYFCSSVTFLTSLSVSVLLKLKLSSSEYTKECQNRSGILKMIWIM